MTTPSNEFSRHTLILDGGGGIECIVSIVVLFYTTSFPSLFVCLGSEAEEAGIARAIPTAQAVQYDQAKVQ